MYDKNRFTCRVLINIFINHYNSVYKRTKVIGSKKVQRQSSYKALQSVLGFGLLPELFATHIFRPSGVPCFLCNLFFLICLHWKLSLTSSNCSWVCKDITLLVLSASWYFCFFILVLVQAFDFPVAFLTGLLLLFLWYYFLCFRLL